MNNSVCKGYSKLIEVQKNCFGDGISRFSEYGMYVLITLPGNILHLGTISGLLGPKWGMPKPYSTLIQVAD